MGNNFYYNNGFGTPVGNLPQRVNVAGKNLLSKDQIDILKQNNLTPQEEFFRKPTKIDMDRTFCTHRDGNGNLCVERVTDEDGNEAYHCPICNHTFHYLPPEDPTTFEKAKVAAGVIDDCLNSIKININNPDDGLKNVLVSGYVVNQIPKMLKISSDMARRLKDQIAQSVNGVAGGPRGYDPSSMYSALLSGSVAGVPGFATPQFQQQPVMNYAQQPGYAAPQMMGQPQMQQQMPQGQPQPMQAQPQAYAQPGMAGMMGQQFQYAQPAPMINNPIAGQVVAQQQQTTAPAPAATPAPQTQPAATQTANVSVGTTGTMPAAGVAFKG